MSQYFYATFYKNLRAHVLAQNCAQLSTLLLSQLPIYVHRYCAHNDVHNLTASTSLKAFLYICLVQKESCLYKSEFTVHTIQAYVNPLTTLELTSFVGLQINTTSF